MLRIRCSRWTGFGVHDGPENALAVALWHQEAMRSQRQHTAIDIGKLIYQDIDQRIGQVEGGQAPAGPIGQIKDQWPRLRSAPKDT
jgi:hypothetical protein